MGLCVPCVHAPLEDDEKTRIKKIRPLLFGLEQDFAQSAGDDSALDREELTELWKKNATKNGGKLSDDEARLIELSAQEAFAEMDVDGSGKVSRQEFVAQCMGATEVRGSLRDMRAKVQAKLREDPGMLKNLVDSFKMWDRNGDGYVTEQELDEHLETLAGEVKGSTSVGCMMACQGPSAADDAEARELARKLKEELLAVADVDGDGRLDLWEVVAWALGRKKTPVELILYDISKGATRWAGPLLLGRFDVEAFHSSLLVYGSEYWYGGKIFRSEPPCSKQFGAPITKSKNLKVQPSEVRPEVPVVRLGYTFVTHEEFAAFLKEKCINRYTGVETYDLLTHSCTHFSDECLHFLLGRGIPAPCNELQRMAMIPAVKAIRPYLNRHLGGFSEETGGGDQLLEDQIVKEGPNAIKVDDLLGTGMVVILEGGRAGIDEEGSHVIATVLKDEGDTLEVKYVDPSTGAVTTKAGVPQAAVLRKVE